MSSEVPAGSESHPPVTGGSPRPSAAHRRLWRPESPTDTQPIVASLRRTPYRDPKRMTPPREDYQARHAVDLAVRAGELLLRCGASTRDVESSVVAVAAAAGLERIEVDITNQSMLVQCIGPHGATITVLRVVRSSTRDFSRLVAVHRFVEDLVAGRVDRAEAADQLRRIATAPRFWPRWMVSLSFGVLAAAVAALLGAGLLAVVLSLVSAVLVDQVGRFFSRRGLASFYLSAIGAAIATTFAWAAYAVGPGVSREDFALIVAGGIVVLLPGRAMVSALEDAVTGFPVTGVGRLFGVLLTAAGIIVGVAAGLSLTLWLDETLGLGVPSPSRLELANLTTPLVLEVMGALVAAGASAVTSRARRSMVLPAALLGAAAMLTTDLLQRAGFGELTSVAMSCVLVGFAGRLGALRLGAPALVMVVPALTPLLPGLTIFLGMYELVSQAGAAEATSAAAGTGLTTLLTASSVALAMAAGAVLGDVLAAPFDRRIVRQRRARRR